MPFDTAKNFAKGTLSSGISAIATSLTLTTGHSARFPAVPFNAVIWNSTDYSDPADAYHAGAAETVRCTNISTETWTITRAQESTAAVALNTSGKTYTVIAPLTAKGVNTDVYNAPVFAGLATVGGYVRFTPSAMAANAIDITSKNNTKSLSADTTFTFSATPSVTGSEWGMEVTNTDTVSHTLTIPSSRPVGRATAITTVTIPASSTIQLNWKHNGSVNLISGDVTTLPLLHYTWAFDPKALCDGTFDGMFLMTVGDHAPNGFVVTDWKLSFEADPVTEVDLDLKRADAFIGRANSAVMDVLDTTAGASSESTAANINGGVAVANGKVIYLSFGTAYTEANHQCIFELWGYAVT